MLLIDFSYRRKDLIPDGGCEKTVRGLDSLEQSEWSASSLMPPHLKKKLQVSLVIKRTKEREPCVFTNDLYKSTSWSFGQDFPM
jgi:hypothetical protein